jgi:hypothetical protein
MGLMGPEIGTDADKRHLLGSRMASFDEDIFQAL